jgi:chemotaxis protein CheZ
MVSSGVDPDGLAGRLTEMRDRYMDADGTVQLVTVAEHRALLAELRMLADFIEEARREVAAVGVDEIVRLDVPAATDELDAVTVHTAEATGLILDECERLEAIVATTPLRSEVNERTARIYEACSFQDLTGQRVAKVVSTLKTIDAKIAEILRVFGRSPPLSVSTLTPDVLLNGPQRQGFAMDQGAIDALLATFE